LVAGTLVYNEIVIIPYWGFDKYTRLALAGRANQSTNAAVYVSSTSPQHAYDDQRNQRKIMMKEEE
jgi:hypothetical protein